MNKVIRTARISSEPVVLPIHVDREMVELAFEAATETFSEADFEAAQAQDLEESAEFTPLGEQAETVEVEEVEEEPKLSMEEAEALVQERLREAEARFLQEKEQEKEAAHQAGFEAGQAQGYAEGHAAGLAEGQAQSQDEIVRFQAMLNHIAERWDQVFKSVDLDVTQLSFAIAKNIVGNVVDEREDFVLQSVRDCLAHVQDTTQLTIYVNPEDLALVRENRTRWQEAYERIESLNIEADGLIDKGGCLIETPSGDIDGQISSRLEKLQVAILERLQGVPQEMAPDVADVVAEDDVADKTTLVQETASMDELETVAEEEVDAVDMPMDAEIVAEEDVDVADDAAEAMDDGTETGLVDDSQTDLQDDVETRDTQMDDESVVEERVEERLTETTDDVGSDLSDVFLPEDAEEDVDVTDTQMGDTVVEGDAQVAEEVSEIAEETIDDMQEVSAVDLEDGVQSALDVADEQIEEGSENVEDSVDEAPESEDDEAGQS